MASPVQGVPSKVSTDPKGFVVGSPPLTFTPVTQDQWDLAKTAWGAGKEVKVYYSEDPLLVTKVESA